MQIKEEALQQAILLRTNGMSYRKIADYTRLPYEKIRYQCRKLDCDKAPVDEEMPSKIENREVCSYCGKPITQNEHCRGRKKRFCCEECRRKYWKIHRDAQKQKRTAIYTKVCP